MINIASSQPVHWPVASSHTAVAPVAAVSAVSPAQGSQRESQSGLGSERQSQAHGLHDTRQRKGAEQDRGAEGMQAAPILPGEKAKDGIDARESRAAEADKRELQDAQAAEEERAVQKQKMLDVLVTVWKASAAVVDKALGLDDASKVAGNAAASEGTNAAGLGADGAMAQRAVASEPPVPDSPVAYTEQGASEHGALELGRLVSKRA